MRKAIDDLHAKHPSVELPKNFNKILGLQARCFSQLTAPASASGPVPKKGNFLSFHCFILLIHCLITASNVSVVVNSARTSMKGKKVPGSGSCPSTVRCSSFHSLVVFLY